MRMNRAALLCVSLLLSVGCGTPITIVRQAMPNPFLGGATFALLPLDVQGMTIDGMPPQAWLARNGRDGANLESDLSGAQAVYADGVASVAGTAIVAANPRFTVHTHMGAWSRGYYNYFTNPPTTLTIDVQVTTPDGAVLDEIWINCRAYHSLMRPTPVQGLRVALQSCGEQLGGYLRQRQVALLHRSRALASASARSNGL